jgi:hypothetical protein
MKFGPWMELRSGLPNVPGERRCECGGVETAQPAVDDVPV